VQIGPKKLFGNWLPQSANPTRFDREAHILSSWDTDSEFSHWFRTVDQPVPISPELFEVLSLFDEWRDRTHGALDASAETITRVWKKAASEKRLPSEVELRAAVASVRRVHWKLDPVNRTATHTSDTPLALNSFVKSYIAGSAADAAARQIHVQMGWQGQLWQPSQTG
jgi:thiamine biosynthesis lipoprotein